MTRKPVFMRAYLTKMLKKRLELWYNTDSIVKSVRNTYKSQKQKTATKSDMACVCSGLSQFIFFDGGLKDRFCFEKEKGQNH